MNSRLLKYRSTIGKFNAVKISLASPDDVLKWSQGEVKNIDTLNYRTLKPENGGLFCPIIFGPITDHKCICGRYNGLSHEGIRCEKCHVLVTSSSIRRSNMGHIQLNTMVVHPWFYTYVAKLLHITKKDLIQIINFEKFICIADTKDGQVKKNTMIVTEEYYYSYFTYEEIQTGGEAIYALLTEVDVSQEIEALQRKLEKSRTRSTVQDLNKIQSLIDFYSTILKNGVQLTNMIIKNVPVLAADLRPIIYLEGGGIATTQLNEIYKRIIHRNKRLEMLQSLRVHKVIINNEKHMIAKSINDLIGSSKEKKNRSLSDTMKGKSGYFRRILLGKRVDYSGRAAIVIGPDLKIDECGLSISMASELLKPFIAAELIRRGNVLTYMEAKRFIETSHPLSISILYDIINDFVILLNRAPTLHRLGMQAFRIKLTNNHAISVSAMVCIGYNADFDGDHMAMHLPITIEAREEAYGLMLATNNIFLPGSGAPILMPSKDIVLGLYYMSCEGEKRTDIVAPDIRTLVHFIEAKICNLNTVVSVVVDQTTGKIEETTYGRILLWEGLKIAPFSLFNRTIGKEEIKEIILEFYNPEDSRLLIDFLNYIKDVGFKYLTDSGVTFGLTDIVLHPERESRIVEGYRKQDLIENSYEQGLITYQELSTKILTSWHEIIEDMSTDTMNLLENAEITGGDRNGINMNNMYLMYISKARGSKSQIQQLSAMRGFMAKHTGEISMMVISSNFLTGLSALEYFNSTNGERKGLNDITAKTSRSGYLTRRLADVARNIVIQEEECGSMMGVKFSLIEDIANNGVDIFDAIYGRVLLHDVVRRDEQVVALAGQIIDRQLYKTIISQKSMIDTITVRTVVFCLNENGVCRNCYGIDLAYHDMVAIGTSIGVTAAQSIGEPGTQLTMRTFHSGGVASLGRITQEGHIMNKIAGRLDLSEVEYIVRDDNMLVVLQSSKVLIRDENDFVVETIIYPYGFESTYKHNTFVEDGTILGFYNSMTRPILAPFDGTVNYVDLIEGINYNYNENLGQRSVMIDTLASYNLFAYAVLKNEYGERIEFPLENNTIIIAQRNSFVKRGDVIGKVYTISKLVTSDIIGGLSQVVDYFEGKRPRREAIIAKHSGTVHLDIAKNKKNFILSIIDENNAVVEKHNISIQSFLFFNNGMRITQGDKITEGKVSLHDILSLFGVENMIKLFTVSVATIYTEQGSNVHFKHIEIILRQMLKKVIITDQGDSQYTNYRTENYISVLRTNIHLKKHGKRMIKFINIFNSITKVALDYSGSFISAASFQNTILVLAKSALLCEVDNLYGVKENIICGRMINVGTGFISNTVDAVVKAATKTMAKLSKLNAKINNIKDSSHHTDIKDSSHHTDIKDSSHHTNLSSDVENDDKNACPAHTDSSPETPCDSLV